MTMMRFFDSPSLFATTAATKNVPFVTSATTTIPSSTQLWANNNSNKQSATTSNDESSSSLRNNQTTNNKMSTPNQNKFRHFMTIASIAAVAMTTALPTISHAADVSSIAASTNGFLSSISETGFYQAFSLVFVSEIGDKTFFMAGLLAVQTSRFISFLGSMAALGVMTIISVLIGQIFHVVPAGFGEGIPLDDVAAALAFAFFGYKTLKEALEMDPNGSGVSVMDEELAEAQEEVDGSSASKQSNLIAKVLSIFGLVFAAEFGDRSFLSTIALSAAQNPISVAGGAIAAHAVATGIAVAGGAALSKYLSERVIGIIGGSLFLVFAVTTALGIF
eukprot:CAMPEP_0119547654 /NCGR_PEP_ID=MMETSP1352-20130426/1719_1 /TAXON_ID=265584 /ORGANISM="Stauroneis constricta, Strain CCMP1120" /LENGTH=333 /DNA_ID=CAMNT_0007592635 /DNA_START=190 /DNA_END=1191 /DNA_ORIENTATION=-